MKRKIRIAIALCFYVFAVLPAKLWPRARPSLTVLYYHAVPDLHAESFERQMRSLSQSAHVTTADLSDFDLQRNRLNRPLIAVTFDDAFESVLDNAIPILEKYNIPCTIFVPTDCMGGTPNWAMETTADATERVATPERLRKLPTNVVTIGSHSLTHPHMSRLPATQAAKELVDSKALLSSLVERGITTFAFPYGDYSSEVVTLCKEAGYKYVFTVDPESIELGRNDFVRGRVKTDPSDGRLEFYLKCQGCYAWVGRLTKFVRRSMGRHDQH
jgi:peptidoglycan/xylan/chitin deacetylase (PgdA/CDA1 family)